MPADPLAALLADPRVTARRSGPPDPAGRCVLYWMQRAQRARGNHALTLAVRLGDLLGLPVAVYFALTPSFPGANLRHYKFLVEGLAETRRDLAARGTPLLMTQSAPDEGALAAVAALKPAIVIGDENPARVPEGWRRAVGDRCPVPFHTVDADVICPMKLFPKEEFAARTIRPKIHRVLEQFVEPPADPRPRTAWRSPPTLPGDVTDPLAALADLPIDRSVGEVSRYFTGGTSRAEANLRRFVTGRLRCYHNDRNTPELEGTSELSAYLHFGQIGVHTIVDAVRRARVDEPALSEGAEAYLEELIVRREVAVNFVARNPNYDRLEGCPDWARKTLAAHAGDKRVHLYDRDRLLAADTHDELWNAAQAEMNKTGRMHGYLRMYWAKKILEWSPSPEAAFDTARTFNDTLFLDGRDPNGWTGVAWAIGGKHDRPWAPQRPIFGTVRYMSFASTSRKFDWKAYARTVQVM